MGANDTIKSHELDEAKTILSEWQKHTTGHKYRANAQFKAKVDSEINTWEGIINTLKGRVVEDSKKKRLDLSLPGEFRWLHDSITDVASLNGNSELALSYVRASTFNDSFSGKIDDGKSFGFALEAGFVLPGSDPGKTSSFHVLGSATGYTSGTDESPEMSAISATTANGEETGVTINVHNIPKRTDLVDLKAWIATQYVNGFSTKLGVGASAYGDFGLKHIQEKWHDMQDAYLYPADAIVESGGKKGYVLLGVGKNKELWNTGIYIQAEAELSQGILGEKSGNASVKTYLMHDGKYTRVSAGLGYEQNWGGTSSAINEAELGGGYSELKIDAKLGKNWELGGNVRDNSRGEGQVELGLKRSF